MRPAFSDGSRWLCLHMQAIHPGCEALGCAHVSVSTQPRPILAYTVTPFVPGLKPRGTEPEVGSDEFDHGKTLDDGLLTAAASCSVQHATVDYPDVCRRAVL